MRTSSIISALNTLADFRDHRASVGEVAAWLGTVEQAPAARNLRVIRPNDTDWARIQMWVDDDGSIAWISLEPAPHFTLTVSDLQDVFGEPSEVLRVHRNIPERVKFHYQKENFTCSLLASFEDGVDRNKRPITELLICPSVP